MVTARDRAIDLYMGAIRDGDARAALDRNIGARYTQHSTGVRDGKEGFLEFFEPFLKRNPVREMQVLHALQDGPFVFLHVYQNLNNGEAEWLTGDFFDSDADGRIVEHWDVIAAMPAGADRQRMLGGGIAEITDLERTQANKAHVAAFFETCLIGGAQDRMAEYVRPDSACAAVLGAAEGAEALRVEELVMMVGEGNFVATLNRARRGAEDLCTMVLFRLEAGMIAECRALSEPLPAAHELVNSGKF